MPSRKRLLFFLLIGLLTVAVGVIPDLVSDELKAWCLQRFGPSYPWYFIGFFVVGCFVLVALSGEFKDLFLKPQDAIPQAPEREQQTQEIRTYLRERYQNRLNQKLASRQPVNLRRLTSKEGTSERVSDTFVPYNSEEIKEEIGNTFQAAHGRMLIVGQPGAGKTTLLLQLADRLFDLEAGALPIVINLATWQSSYGKLETWLEAVLAAELGTNKAGAQAVLRQSGLILLLDGLDELKNDKAMNSCLAAIADYGATPGRRFVITCRVEEYKRVPEDARVNLQIEVGPLTGEQLEAELTRMGREQPEAIPLLQAIQKDPLLRQAVETPFYFNTLQLLFAGRLPVFSAGDLEGRKAEIKEIFVAAALQNTQKQEYPPERARHWLAFLASQMHKRNLVVFELRDLQYSWWRGWSRWSLFVANLIAKTIYIIRNKMILLVLLGFLYKIFYELNSGIVIGLLVWSAVTMFIVLLGGLVLIPLGALFVKRDFIFIHHIKWSCVKYFKWLKNNYLRVLIDGLIDGIPYGLFFMLIFGPVVGSAYGMAIGTVFALAYAVALWPIFGLALVFLGDRIGNLGNRSLPKIITLDLVNWSLKSYWEWLKAYLIIPVIIGLMVGLLANWRAGIIVSMVFWVAESMEALIKDKSSDFIQIKIPYQRFIASIKFLHFPILQHFHLRYLLHKKGALPLDLVDFLNEMSARHLLETDGATWRFRHRIIQDYFAEQWVEPEPEQKN